MWCDISKINFHFIYSLIVFYSCFLPFKLYNFNNPMNITETFFLCLKERNMLLLTTIRFHIFAASATVVQTVLQPANNINFCGLLYSKLYITLAPSPGSHCKEKNDK